MEIICNNCGYRKNLGKTVERKTLEFECPECQGTNMKLVDASGVNIKVDGITEDVIVDIVKELASNISLTDIVGFFAKPKKQDNQEENK